MEGQQKQKKNCYTHTFSQNMVNVSYGVEGNDSKGVVIGQDCDGGFVWCSKGDTVGGALQGREKGKYHTVTNIGASC